MDASRYSKKFLSEIVVIVRQSVSNRYSTLSVRGFQRADKRLFSGCDERGDVLE